MLKVFINKKVLRKVNIEMKFIKELYKTTRSRLFIFDQRLYLKTLNIMIS
jgi:hypothetical protein